MQVATGSPRKSGGSEGDGLRNSGLLNSCGSGGGGLRNSDGSGGGRLRNSGSSNPGSGHALPLPVGFDSMDPVGEANEVSDRSLCRKCGLPSKKMALITSFCGSSGWRPRQ